MPLISRIIASSAAYSSSDIYSQSDNTTCLRDIAFSNKVGCIGQVAILVEYAHEIFEGILREVTVVSSRVEELVDRTRQIEISLNEYQSDFSLLSPPQVDGEDHVIVHIEKPPPEISDLSNQIKSRYESISAVPNFSAIGGSESQYSDPSLFLRYFEKKQQLRLDRSREDRAQRKALKAVRTARTDSHLTSHDHLPKKTLPQPPRQRIRPELATIPESDIVSSMASTLVYSTEGSLVPPQTSQPIPNEAQLFLSGVISEEGMTIDVLSALPAWKTKRIATLQRAAKKAALLGGMVSSFSSGSHDTANPDAGSVKSKKFLRESVSFRALRLDIEDHQQNLLPSSAPLSSHVSFAPQQELTELTASAAVAVIHPAPRPFIAAIPSVSRRNLRHVSLSNPTQQPVQSVQTGSTAAPTAGANGKEEGSSSLPPRPFLGAIPSVSRRNLRHVSTRLLIPNGTSAVPARYVGPPSSHASQVSEASSTLRPASVRLTLPRPPSSRQADSARVAPPGVRPPLPFLGSVASGARSGLRSVADQVSTTSGSGASNADVEDGDAVGSTITRHPRPFLHDIASGVRPGLRAIPKDQDDNGNSLSTATASSTSASAISSSRSSVAPSSGAPAATRQGGGPMSFLSEIQAGVSRLKKAPGFPSSLSSTSASPPVGSGNSGTANNNACLFGGSAAVMSILARRKFIDDNSDSDEDDEKSDAEWD